jgi:transposase
LNNGGFLGLRNDEGVQMSQKSLNPKPSSERLVKDIRRAMRKHYSAEDKIRIVLDELRLLKKSMIGVGGNQK